MLLPGFYLYVVEGCRPEDYSEDETMGEKSWAFAFSFGLAALYGMRISMVFCVCMGAVAALMVLPGLYLYMVDGCRPEDVEEEGFVNEKKDGLSMLLLLGLGVASVYGICVSTVFSVFMAVVVVLMLLPGLYLWLDGCRPEDYEEVDESHKQGNSFLPWFVCLGLLSFSWFGIYTHCYVFMGAMAALMFLPGLYLYVVDGCRPEDFEEEANTNEARDMAFLLLLAGVALRLSLLSAKLHRLPCFLGSGIGPHATAWALPLGGGWLQARRLCRGRHWRPEECCSSCSFTSWPGLGLSLWYVDVNCVPCHVWGCGCYHVLARTISLCGGWLQA